MADHQPMSVSGYTTQSQAKIDAVNSNKQLEEQCLRQLDTLGQNPLVDKRWLAIGRTHLEQAWMAINRSIFQPTRVTLDGDAGHE